MSVLVVGSSNMDISVYVDAHPQIGETIMGNSISYSHGGKGANQAATCAKLGADVTFLTCVGEDDYGRSILNSLKSFGVNCEHVKKTDKNPTGTAIITVDQNGSNSIIVIPGANMDCDVNYLKENIDLFKNCEYVLLQMEIPFESIEFAIETAKKYKKKVVLNPAPASADFDRSYYSKVDILTPNETELALLTGRNIEGLDVQDAANQLIKEGAKTIVVTVGEDGSIAISDKKEPIISNAYNVDAVDTVGAGDCYNGALISSLVSGKNLTEAMEFANIAAAISVTRKGAQSSIPNVNEVYEFKNNYKEDK